MKAIFFLAVEKETDFIKGILSPVTGDR